MKPITERPLAAEGFTSYRCKGQFGWIMIGATDRFDAMSQARRSRDDAKSSDLQIWDGTQYVPCPPLSLTYEEFAAMRGAGRQKIGDAGLHRSSERKSEATHRRQVSAQFAKDGLLLIRRGELQLEYDRLLAEGEIVRPTEKEQVLARADGDPTFQSVAAARRIAIRRGWLTSESVAA